jgi:hypothetical protein
MPESSILFTDFPSYLRRTQKTSAGQAELSPLPGAFETRAANLLGKG